MDGNLTNEDIILQSPPENEKELKAFFNKKAKLIFFDIGSCDGLDSVRYAKIFPNSKIFAFEPLEKNFLLIKKNMERYKCTNIYPFNLALSEKAGQSEFFVSSGRPDNIDEYDSWDYGNKSSSLLAPEKHLQSYSWIKFDNKIQIKTQTLYDFCKKMAIEVIDFIHLDVQGAELMVLKGAKEKINSIKMIWLEVANVELYKNQPLRADINSYLIQNGFTLLKDTLENNDYGDQLWVNYKYFFKKRTSHFIYKVYRNVSKRCKCVLKND